MVQKKRSQTKGSTFGRILNSIMTRATKLGPKKSAFVSSVLALICGALIFWQYLLPMNAAAEAVRKENTLQNKQIAIAQMVQETRPAFIEEYGRAKDIYGDLRDLLPNSTELSEVMAAIQDIARRNNVRITLFDASTPDVKSNAVPAPAPPPADSTQAPGAANPGADAPSAPPAPRTVLNERIIPAQLVGNHASIMNFIRDVASYQLIIDTRDLAITSLNKQENVNLKLVAFDAPPTSALPPDPPELRETTKQTKTALLTPVH